MPIKDRKDIIRQISNLVGSLSSDEKNDVLRQLMRNRDDIPISVFEAPLSGLEIVVKFLKEDARRTPKEIAELLNRKLPTIYATYTVSKKKFSPRLNVTDTSIMIPISVLQNRAYSALEAMAHHLREKEHLTMKEIAALLHRSYSTIKTVERRHDVKTQ